MSERVWTDDQNKAINSRGGTLLLSAAAGSGKTAVLVERIIKLLTQGNNPIPPSELLVVTFTIAAASEMRMRISAAVDDLIAKDPSNSMYRNIKMHLSEAQISTIDSFCIKLVRENFAKADIEPDFTILDSSEDKIIMADSIARAFDRLCLEEPEIYDMLNSMTSYNMNDSELAKKVIKLYSYSRSHPFPDLWLDSIVDMYEKTNDVKGTIWGKIIVEYIDKRIEEVILLAKNAIVDVAFSEEFHDKYTPVFEDIISDANAFKLLLKNGSWDDIYSFVNSYVVSKLPAAKRGTADYPEKVAAKKKHDTIVKIIKDLPSFICATTAEFNDDIDLQRPLIEQLIKTVKSFAKIYQSAKEERNAYNFTDIMHKAIKLLVTVDEDGSLKKSSMAYDIGNRYAEILIDEYQDTNEAQNMLFEMLSKDGKNMFTVGDVKQSIYRFRLAMPEIFLKKSKEYAHYDGSTYPATVTLGMNFRSRKGILDSINFLFRNIMSEYVGEMEYTDSDALYYGNQYDEDTEPAFELHFTDEDKGQYVASLVKRILKSGMQIQAKGAKRAVRAGDICILLRSPSSSADVYEKAIRDIGIGCASPKNSGLFDTYEAKLLMAFLRVINNPTDDVSMLSVMMSPMYGFTPDEVANMRISDKKASFYACLKASEIEKSKKLLADIESYSAMAAVTPFDVFVRNIIEYSGISACVLAMKNASIRKLNLLQIFNLSSKYTESVNAGLSGFIRYIERLIAQDSQISVAHEPEDDGNSVTIMSIHRSKGLEFPVVILADCSKPLNKMDSKDDMIISSDAGVGMAVINNEKLQKYKSLGQIATRISIMRASASEEMRVLYVAMTRAKEKLYAVINNGNAEEKLADYSGFVDENCKACESAVLGANDYATWLYMGFSSHPDVAKEIKCVDVNTKPKESDIKCVINLVDDDALTPVDEVNTSENEGSIEKIKAAAQYVYPYTYPKGARPKHTASEFESKRFIPEYFAKSKPDFLLGDKLNAAQAGTANHLLLQNLDFNAKSVESEIERLETAGIINHRQSLAIRRDEINKFLSSDFCNRIRNADAIYREMEFTAEIKLSDLAEANENVADEKIVILGKADLVFVENNRAVIVDYKTDRTKSREELIDAYSGQLDIYKKAMEQLLDVPVGECVIYSLTLSEAIKI